LQYIRIWRDFPFFGTGLGTFGSISSMYKTTLDQVLYTHAHNDYLELLSNTGLVGFILVALFFGLYFKIIIKAWLKRNNDYVVCLGLGGICSILGMLVYSLLDFNLQIPANALLFFIISFQSSDNTLISNYNIRDFYQRLMI
jgi:O-antigen ligase